jgi:hypothetical protein
MTRLGQTKGGVNDGAASGAWHQSSLQMTAMRRESKTCETLSVYYPVPEILLHGLCTLAKIESSVAVHTQQRIHPHLQKVAESRNCLSAVTSYFTQE